MYTWYVLPKTLYESYPTRVQLTSFVSLTPTFPAFPGYAALGLLVVPTQLGTFEQRVTLSCWPVTRRNTFSIFHFTSLHI